MTCELNETFSRDDLERIVFYMLSTRLLFYIAQSVISDDRLRRSLSLEDPHVIAVRGNLLSFEKKTIAIFLSTDNILLNFLKIQST